MEYTTVEYRVRPVVRYVLTRWTSAYITNDGPDGDARTHHGSCATVCEVPSEDEAWRIANAFESTEQNSVVRRD